MFLLLLSIYILRNKCTDIKWNSTQTTNPPLATLCSEYGSPLKSSLYFHTYLTYVNLQFYNRAAEKKHKPSFGTVKMQQKY